MADDRPIQPDDRLSPRESPPGARDPLPRARAGDLDAFLDLLRPRVGRLLRLATLAAGGRAAGESATTAVLRTVWRDARRIRDAADLDRRLEQALIVRLPRRRPGGDGSLDRALRGLTPAGRLALAGCLDPHPDAEALATAGRAGVEVPPGRRAPGTAADAVAGTIVDLDGPLAGWDVARLRAALAAASGPVDADRLLDGLRAELGDSRPDGEALAAIRALLPRPAVAARGLALVLAAAVGVTALAWTTSRPEAEEGSAGGSGGAAPSATGAPAVGGGAATAADLDTPGDFPADVDGLPVVGVNAAKRLAGDPSLAGRSIAIRGWLTVPQIRETCSAPAPVAPGLDGTGSPAPAQVPVDDPLGAAAAFCLREAVLREAPGADWGVAHLHPQLLPGTALGRIRRVFAATDGEPVPVVVVAHFGDARAASCTGAGRHCGEEMVVDRIAWTLGAPSRPPTAIRETRTGTEPLRSPAEVLEIAENAYGSLRAVSVTGIPEAELHLVEPGTADLAWPGGPASAGGYAWLVRAMVEPRPGDPPGAVRTWLLVDDRTATVVAAPGSVAGGGDTPGTGFLFPKRVDGLLVRSVADARALTEAGLPDGATIAVAGWLATPALAGACIAEAVGIDGPLDGRAAFCRRATTLRGPSTDGRGLALQMPPGTPGLPIDGAVAGRGMPVPVVALVQAGSPRSEPCWPTADGCGRALVLERLLWVDGSPTDVAIAELDGEAALPRLAVADVRTIAEEAVADLGRVVSIVRVPAAQRGLVAPGADASRIAGDHAWIVRVRSPMVRAGWTTGLDYLWWLMVDDTTGRPSTDARPIAALPGPTPTARAG